MPNSNRDSDGDLRLSLVKIELLSEKIDMLCTNIDSIKSDIQQKALFDNEKINHILSLIEDRRLTLMSHLEDLKKELKEHMKDVLEQDKKNDEKEKEQDQKIYNLNKLRWIAYGASLVIGFIIAKLNFTNLF